MGDAFNFLDPVFSSGVFLALRSSEMAAEAVDRAENMRRVPEVERCVRGHLLQGSNVHWLANGRGRTCLACKTRQVPCAICGVERSYTNIRSHVRLMHERVT